ncbi:MAG: LexA family transcriptional regulator [Bacteroidota bacterium]|nr:LexA family transcriptional regulator [Bacteroidota bacterium]MDX5404307.1 LexA family transcriptional regulator [Bacteroidota bacterium]MDX5426943.1 LexA family transcriptional regulator [Bacteroidota bacterium]MDX5447316.1 LexA family transcriptional regulator [Bacteroidota bacterium]MDX5504931.1 LexA family transcriptional regulator [Bacteroidota bacterium]
MIRHRLPQNLKFLRKRKNLSQEQLAQELELTRSTLSAYENGTAEPNLMTLLRIADYFRVSLDRLARQNLSGLGEKQLSELDRGLDVDIMGRHLRILTTSVNTSNEENVDVVPARARAGYTTGYADPEFIEKLPKMSLPFLDKNRTHRAFPIQGDSMPPVSEGSLVIGEYLQDWSSIKDGTPCIVLTQDDGVVFKVAFNWIKDRGTLQLCSTNPAYDPYEVRADEILEIWRFVYYISPDLPLPRLNEKEVTRTLLALQREVDAIKRRSEK